MDMILTAEERHELAECWSWRGYVPRQDEEEEEEE